MFNFQEIIDGFLAVIEEHNLSYTKKTIEQEQKIYTIYSIDFCNQLVDYVSNFTGLVPKNVHQYVAAQQFLYLFADQGVIDIQINLITTNKSFYISFSKKDIDFELDGKEFLSIFINYDDSLNVMDVHNINVIELIDFEISYLNILADIKKHLDPSIITFDQVNQLVLANRLKIFKERAAAFNAKFITSAQFCDIYLKSPDIFIEQDYYLPISQQVFIQFLKDNLPPKFVSLLRSIDSLTSYQESVCNHNIDWAFSSYNIYFPTISKFSNDNSLYSLMFNVMPNGQHRIIIDICDNGSVAFYYTNSAGDNVLLDCLDDIYDYIKEQFILNLEKALHIHRSTITVGHLKIYEMIFA